MRLPDAAHPGDQPGILFAPTIRLKAWLAAFGNDNAQGEYYLTDIIPAAVRDGVAVNAVHPPALWENIGRQQQDATGGARAPAPA